VAKKTCGTGRYQAAIFRLASARGHAETLAMLHDYFAEVLRGGKPDPEGPPLSPEVASALRGLDGAREGLRREWEPLSDQDTEGVPDPDLVEGEAA
jgi:hypothetical protein